MSDEFVIKTIKQSKLFDDEYYFNQTKEIINDTVEHYIKIGYKKGFNPNKLFDGDFYLKENADVAFCNVNPFYHFIVAGMYEKRYFNKYLFFDADYYLDINENIYGINPFLHWIKFGIAQHKMPNSTIIFDADYYIKTNTDINLNMDPFYHYIYHGIYENRLPHVNTTCYNRKLSDDKEKEILSKINKRLEEIFEDDVDIFKNLLNKSGATITGSFIIQCILDVRWENSDIDILIPIVDCVNFRTCIVTDIELFLLKKFKYLPTNYNTYDLVHGGIIGIKNCVREFCIDNKYISKIQVGQVLLSEKDLYEYICKIFDSDFCKNMYNIKNGKENINIYNIDAILNKKCDSPALNCIDRYKKYCNRGFEYNNINIYTVYNGLIQNCEENLLFEIVLVSSNDYFHICKYHDYDELRLMKINSNYINICTKNKIIKIACINTNCNSECILFICKKLHYHFDNHIFVICTVSHKI